MPRTKFRRPVKPKEEPLIAIRQGRFHYNAHFARLAELPQQKEVSYFIDADLREIAFEFHREPGDPDGYKVEDRGGIAKHRSAAQDLISKHSWIRAVSMPKHGCPTAFRARKDGKQWVIRLCPAFEFTRSRQELDRIPAGTSGIYRYRRLNDEIVYIGKGDIRRRAQEPERADWDFAHIDYSIIEGSDEQFEWENYWLELFREKSDGSLPLYNRQSGNSG